MSRWRRSSLACAQTGAELEEPVAIWDGDVLADVLRLIERPPESELTRCFAPGFGIRVHDESVARAEVLFCFKCDMALMIDPTDPRRREVGATFDSESRPARELLSHFRSCTADDADLTTRLLTPSMRTYGTGRTDPDIPIRAWSGRVIVWHC